MSNIIQNNSHPAQGLGATQGANASNKASASGDQLMYEAMLAMTLELQTLSNAQTSCANLSTALYDHMVSNETNRLKDMQRHLDDYSWLQEHFEAFQKYFEGKGPMPQLGPGMSKGDLSIMRAFYKEHPNLTSTRMAVMNLSQSIGAQNTYVSDAKALPENLENNVKALADDETQVSTLFAPLLALMKTPYQQPW